MDRDLIFAVPSTKSRDSMDRDLIFAVPSTKTGVSVDRIKNCPAHKNRTANKNTSISFDMQARSITF